MLTREAFRKTIEALQWISFPKGTPDEERTIPAEWITELVPEPNRTAQYPIRMKSAIVDGDLLARYSTFPFELELLDCDVRGNVDFFGSHFQRNARFLRSRFTGNLLLSHVHTAHNLILQETTVGGTLNLNDADIRGLISASAAHFRGPVMMERASAKSVFFRPKRTVDGVQPTRFEGIARFHDMRVGTLEGDGCQFAGEANFTRIAVAGATRFNAAMVDETLEPIDAIVTRFGGDTTFRHANLGGEANFAGAVFAAHADFTAAHVEGRALFEAEATKGLRARFEGSSTFDALTVGEHFYAGGCDFVGECSMRSMRINGYAAFIYQSGKALYAATFSGPVAFNQTHVDGYVDFTAVTFRDSASFQRVRVGGVARFHVADWSEARETCVFEGDASFHQMSVGGDAWFYGAHFRKNATFADWQVATDVNLSSSSSDDAATFGGEMNMERGRIGGDLISAGITFSGPTAFDSLKVGTAVFDRSVFPQGLQLRLANVGRKLSLEGAKITGTLDLRDAYAAVLILPPLETIDARGFSFERIDGDVADMLRRQQPYDLQIYQKSEKFLRESGDDNAASGIYLHRRWRETSLHWRRREYVRALSESIQGVLFRFGVRPLRLIALTVIMLALGTYVFSRPDAVKLKDKPNLNRTLSMIEAFGYSMRVFMPVGDLPAGAQLIPTERRLPSIAMTYEAYATLHRIAGLLLVPLGIAAVTGVLVKKRT